jgi:hypothetical protein
MPTVDHNIGIWENANFFAENCRKSQKIVIITSTNRPGANVTDNFADASLTKFTIFLHFFYNWQLTKKSFVLPTYLPTAHWAQIHVSRNDQITVWTAVNQWSH